MMGILSRMRKSQKLRVSLAEKIWSRPSVDHILHEIKPLRDKLELN